MKSSLIVICAAQWKWAIQFTEKKGTAWIFMNRVGVKRFRQVFRVVATLYLHFFSFGWCKAPLLNAIKPRALNILRASVAYRFWIRSRSQLRTRRLERLASKIFAKKIFLFLQSSRARGKFFNAPKNITEVTACPQWDFPLEKVKTIELMRGCVSVFIVLIPARDRSRWTTMKKNEIIYHEAASWSCAGS